MTIRTKSAVTPLALAGMLLLLGGCTTVENYTLYQLNSIEENKGELLVNYTKTSISIAKGPRDSKAYNTIDHYQKKLDRSKLRDGDEIDLRGADSVPPPSVHEVYADADFLVLEDPAAPMTETVTTRGVSSTVSCEEEGSGNNNRDRQPVRMDDQLILCGMIIPAGGQPVPAEGKTGADATVLFKHRYDPGVYLAGALYFIRDFDRDPLGTDAPQGQMEMIKVDARTFQVIGTVALPFRLEEAHVSGTFRNGFVIRPHGITTLLYTCTLEKCRKFDLKSKNILFSFARLVEDSGETVVVLKRTNAEQGLKLKDELANPMFRVSIMQPEP